MSTVVAPTEDDPVVRSASEVIGGPAGPRLAKGSFRLGGLRFGAVSVLVLLAVAMIGLGVVQKQHCRIAGWGVPDQFWHACYSDIPAVYGSNRLDAPDAPGLGEAVTNRLGQPPLAGTAIWLVSKVVPAGQDAAASGRRFFDTSAVLLGVALIIGVAAVGAVKRRRPWDAAQLAASPVLLTSALISYDMLGVTLIALGVLAWTRQRPLLAGLALGLAVGVRPVSSMVALAIVLLAIRTGRWLPVAKMVALWLVAFVGLRVLLYADVGGGLLKAWRTWRLEGPGYGSIWMTPQLLAAAKPQGKSGLAWWPTAGLNANQVSIATLVGFCVVVGVVLWVVLSPRYSPSPAHLALILVAGSLVVSKSIPPQVSILLLPLIALVGLRWRDQLVWAVCEIGYFVGVWLYIAAQSDAGKGLPPAFYLLLLLARVAAIAYLGVRAVQSAEEPDDDLLAADGPQYDTAYDDPDRPLTVGAGRPAEA